MADLDDALLPIPEVLGFSATLACEGTRDRLHLQVLLLAGTRETVSAALMQALDSVTALRQARSAGQLGVTLGLQQRGYASAPSPAERNVLDKRGMSA